MKTAIITSKNLREGRLRFEGKYYLNEDSMNSRAIENHPTKCIVLSDIATVFNPPIFKRQFCQPTKNAVQYFQSSDVPVNIENSTVYVNKYQVEKIGALVQQNDILVTGFGTIGNVRMVSKTVEGSCFANNVCRIRANENVGFIYAFFASKYGKSQLNKNASGAVVRYIEAPGIKRTLIPVFPTELQNEIDGLIRSAASLRDQANELLDKAKRLLKDSAGLRDLTKEDYNFFGGHTFEREVSTFRKNIKCLGTTSFNAFNYSERLQTVTDTLPCKTVPLKECLQGGDTFSTGSFPRREVEPGKGIHLINQSDIFDTIIKGKYISKRNVKLDNLVSYGEVFIAGVGTLGENETFCRTIFAGEELEGELISGEFIRMKTTPQIPSGFLYAWLSTDYGFRYIRGTHSGTKLCRPIPKLLKEIPVPVISSETMLEIDSMVKEAHTMFHQANNNERKAISLVETEIESWNHKPTKK